MSKMECPICKTREVEVIQDTDEKGYESIDCISCGKYYLKKFLPQFINKDKSNFHKVSSWIIEQNDEWNNIPEIDKIKFDEILNMKDKKIKEKFDLFMFFLQNSPSNIEFSKDYEIVMGHLGMDVDKNISKLCQDILVKCWCKDYKELEQIFRKALDLNYIIGDIIHETSFKYIKTTFDGLEYIENLEEPNKNLKNIFIAFNFTEELIPVFSNQVKEAVEETGFNYIIVNQETTPHDQKITDEIIAKIKSSRMIIADFTNSSTNVYFEAGFAMGMKIPVIWTCKKGHEFSFDTGQFPHITWKDADDLKKQLVNRIEIIV